MEMILDLHDLLEISKVAQVEPHDYDEAGKKTLKKRNINAKLLMQSTIVC